MKNSAKIALLFSPMLVLLLIDCSNTIHWFNLIKQSNKNSFIDNKYTPRKEDAIIFKMGSLENSAKIKWKNNHEFIYNSIFYDVIAIEKISTGFLVYCIDDDEETIISKKLKNIGAQKEKHNKHLPFAKKTIYSKIQIPIINNRQVDIDKSINKIKESFYNSINKDLESPPPQFIQYI